ncbi:MAG: sulfocyanin-like copper-binding protein [Hassallia sp.]
MKFELSQSTVPAGDVEFVVTNKGKMPHEMEVVKTDLTVDKLPVSSDGRLDTDKAGKEIGEIEEDDLKSGATKTLKVNLTPGKYLIVCNLPGHFKAGMRTFLTVQ